VTLGIKKKTRKRKRRRMYGKNVHIGYKWWKIMTMHIQQRDENNNKRCRRYIKRKQRRMYAYGR
jgi:hypothetical protein